jgi:hypothetical protein
MIGDDNMKKTWILLILITALDVRSTSAKQPTAPIESIVIARELSMDVISQEMTIKNRAYLLFKNGTILQGVPRVPPTDFDVEASKRLEPKRWGTWSIQGKTLMTTFSSPKRLDDWFKVDPGQKGMRLEGDYRSANTVSSGSNLSGDVAKASTLLNMRFHPDGRFETSQSSDVSFASDNNQGSIEAGSSDQTSGTYTIEPYTLELQFADKHSERWSYFRSSDQNKTLGIGGKYFIRKR